ncbi:MAG TPA: hypothetical protein VHC22_23425 [Pirellulales bacterium]|nr:hypothetical protein [Pirellulales bacterium]
MGKPWRFTFGIRAIFAVVTATCVLMAGWQQAVATRLWIEPNVPPTKLLYQGYGGDATIIHGRFFCRKGSRAGEEVHWVVCHTAPSGEYFSSKFAGHCEARYESPGFYTFEIEIPTIGPRARADIGIRTSTGATGRISYGDLSLPATAPTLDIDAPLGD